MTNHERHMRRRAGIAVCRILGVEQDQPREVIHEVLDALGLTDDASLVIGGLLPPARNDQ